VLFGTPFSALGAITGGSFYQGNGTDHSLLCRAKVANEWVCTATFRVYLVGVCRDNVTFTFYKNRRVSVCLRLGFVTSYTGVKAKQFLKVIGSIVAMTLSLACSTAC
jgi:hypothetical protein